MPGSSVGKGAHNTIKANRHLIYFESLYQVQPGNNRKDHLTAFTLELFKAHIQHQRIKILHTHLKKVRYVGFSAVKMCSFLLQHDKNDSAAKPPTEIYPQHLKI